MTFFLLVFGLSIPFWIAGGLFPRELMPGVPLSALMVLCPAVAAAILVWRQRGWGDVVRLAARAFDFPRIERPAWYAPTLLMMPAIAAAAYGVMRILGVEVPRLEVSWRAVPGMALMILVAAVAEEVGWSGYATPRLQGRMSALRAGLLLGVVTAVWHLIPLVEVGRAAGWAAWQAGNLVATRVLLVWLFNNTGGSVAATALCHATVNLSWQLFPNGGSHYDPRIVGLITAAVAVVVVSGWGPRTLDGRRSGQRAAMGSGEASGRAATRGRSERGSG